MASNATDSLNMEVVNSTNSTAEVNMPDFEGSGHQFEVIKILQKLLG